MWEGWDGRMGKGVTEGEGETGGEGNMGEGRRSEWREGIGRGWERRKGRG